MYMDRHRSIRVSDYPMVHWLSQLLAEGRHRIFDLGGHIGVTYYGFRRYLSYPNTLEWRVHDVPSVIDAGRDWARQYDPDGLLHFNGADSKPQAARSMLEPWRVAVGKAADGAAYHTVYVWGRAKLGGNDVEGLFRSLDAGMSWQRINDDRHRFGRLGALAADPLEFGTVYLAPEGRGVIVGKLNA